MKIAIMSDSHDNWQRLADSVTKANDAECKYLLFAGDLVSPPGLAELEKFQGDVKFVWGNNEMERVGMTRKMDSSKNIELCGDFMGAILTQKQYGEVLRSPRHECLPENLFL